MKVVFKRGVSPSSAILRLSFKLAGTKGESKRGGLSYVTIPPSPYQGEGG